MGKCGRHKAERACSYLGRSRRRADRQVVTTNCEKSAEAIVPEKKIGTFGEGQNLIQTSAVNENLMTEEMQKTQGCLQRDRTESEEYAGVP